MGNQRVAVQPDYEWPSPYLYARISFVSKIFVDSKKMSIFAPMNEKDLLYHGSNVLVEKPQIIVVYFVVYAI